MALSNRVASRVLLPLMVAALPAVLLFSSLRTLRGIDEQRSVYLRHRVALVAARLENLPPAFTAREHALTALGQDEPDLIDIRIVRRGEAGDSLSLAPVWEGRELFQSGLARAGADQVFRAHVPFHSAGVLQIARIELAGSAADFLVAPARHNVIVSSVAGLVLAALAMVTLWAVRRAERMRLRQLDMEHLAHLGRMAAVLAHEIRNPLGTMKGFLQLAGEGGGARTRDLLAPALAETGRLESLVNGLLAYGRPPAPQPRLARWDEIAAGLRAHARQLGAARGARISVTDGGLELHTDPELLGQALLNLLRNAVEAFPGEGGDARIEARIDGGEVVIAVEDNGAGISDEALSRLYEPFFTTKPLGTGLGLAVTRRLVESLGGRLEIRRREGGGTAATVRLAGAPRTSLAGRAHSHGNNSHS